MGPLSGLRVIEVAGLGALPFGGLMLADLGAEVLRLDRLGDPPFGFVAHNPLDRGRRSVAVDLKHPGAPALMLRLAASADVLVEGFRPGVVDSRPPEQRRSPLTSPAGITANLTGRTVIRPSGDGPTYVLTGYRPG